MKKTKEFWKVLFLLVFACTTFSACGDDDDDEFTQESLKSYVIGKWHSYKGVVSANGARESVEITKNNDFSAAYFEIEFQNNGTAVFHAWVPDANGLSRWSQENCTYQVQNNEVLLRDSSGEDISLSFDSKEKALYFRVVSQYYDTPMTVFVYLRK